MVKRISVTCPVAAVAMLISGLLGTVVPASAPAAVRAPIQAGLNQAGPNIGYGTESSLNWAGYGVSGSGPYTRVEGSWVQPKVTCPVKTLQVSAFWVGIDGLSGSDGTIEQIGTDSDCSGGAGDYYAWFEMVPKNVVYLPTSKYPVAAGETMHAEVSASGRSFTLQIEALAGSLVLWHFSTIQTASTLPQESSAEWIAEEPCSGSKCQLANFGSVTFSNAEADGTSIASYKKFTELTMATKNSVTIKARPSALSSAGTGFKVTWAHN